MVGHSVVASFIHRNTHSGYSHLIPALLLNAGEVACALCDPEHEVLIHIRPIKWREKRSLVKGKVVLLWLLSHFDLPYPP